MANVKRADWTMLLPVEVLLEVRQRRNSRKKDLKALQVLKVLSTDLLAPAANFAVAARLRQQENACRTDVGQRRGDVAS